MLFIFCDIGDTVDVVVPPLAESISDGTLATFLKSMLINSLYKFLSMYLLFFMVIGDWLSSCVSFWAEPGDRVNVDEPIAQIETDKVLCWNNMQMLVWKISMVIGGSNFLYS